MWSVGARVECRGKMWSVGMSMWSGDEFDGRVTHIPTPPPPLRPVAPPPSCHASWHLDLLTHQLNWKWPIGQLALPNSDGRSDMAASVPPLFTFDLTKLPLISNCDSADLEREGHWAVAE